MSRKRKAQVRELVPDSIHGSQVIAKFINKVMKQGKKSIAEKIVYGAISTFSEKVKTSPLEAFEKALKNATPLMEVKSRRVGGSTYQVPIEVKKDRGLSLAMRWIIDSARSRSGAMADALSNELCDAFNMVGNALKKKDEAHRMAEANKAFAHFRW